MAGLRGLLVLGLLLVSVEHSECVQCFARFIPSTGECNEEIGEVDEDNCCQNTKYGFMAADGRCQSCGIMAWAPWSSWSHCSTLCGPGVRQRSRNCFGIGQFGCKTAKLSDRLQTEPCDGICCSAEGWGSWLPWSPCSVTCGGVGVKKRQRVCSSPPECRMACSGPSEETETCNAHNQCPVHGGWSGWFEWSPCPASCIGSQGATTIPSKVRYRSCSNPSPSNDTVPPGSTCPGDRFQMQKCSDLPNCPVDGSWGAWSPFRPCSVSCGEGLQLSVRRCDNPAPKYGGRFCDGPSTKAETCQSTCPADGFWTGWSSWSECSATCIPPGRAVVRTRRRSCSNPAPSSNPPGQACQGANSQDEICSNLPLCPVDGHWGPWSPFTSCPVTCGVGLQMSVRRCDNPPPAHGGRSCDGEAHQTKICFTNLHCPEDGVWSEWSRWGDCTSPRRKEIYCTTTFGSQKRTRECRHRAYNGSICIGDNLSETRVCYDVDLCDMKGRWEGWAKWSLCEPPCGENSKRTRKRICTPDYSQYRQFVGRTKEKAEFFGTPKVDCGPVPDGLAEESDACSNVPACS